MTLHEREVQIPQSSTTVGADLVVPDEASGLVVFAHGSGSSRFSARNRHVAQVLQRHGLATLLMDLLTVQEEAADARSGHLRFDIGLLGERLVGAVDWVGTQPDVAPLPLGCFGASTGAAAALVAAATRPERVRAVVSRGGRPDLAGRALEQIRAPTLLIVGGNDEVVLDLNERAALALREHAEVRVEVIPGATHLFEEPGALDRVAQLAAAWFSEHLAG